MMSTLLKHSNKIIAVCGIAFALLLASCNNVIDNPTPVAVENPDPVVTEKLVSVKVGKVLIASMEENLAQRTAFPSFLSNQDMTTYILYDGDTQIAVWNSDAAKSWNAYWVMQNSPVSLTEGLHNLKLSAVDINGTVYTGINKSFSVTEETETIPFTLYFDHVTTGKGKMEISINLPYGKVYAIDYKLYSMSGDEPLYEKSSISSSGITSTTWYSEYNQTYDAGTYILVMEMYADTNKSLPVGTFSEIIYVTGNSQTSKSTVSLNPHSVYNIRYNFNDGSLNGTAQTSVRNVPFTMLQDITLYGSEGDENTVTREGYDFAGWYTDPSFSGVPVTGWTSKSVNSSIDLYARWTYTVSFDSNGSESAACEGTVRSVKANAGENVLLNKNAFTREGYIFDCWNTLPSPTESTPGTKIEDGSSCCFNGHTTLYAQWKERTAGKIAVSFRTNGADLIDIQEITSGSSVTEPDVTYLHHVLLGWYTEEDFSGEAVDFATFAPTEDTILYAKWRPEHHIINYFDWYQNAIHDFSGTHEENYPVEHVYGSETVLDTPAKEECTFLGWYVFNQSTNYISSEPVATLAPEAYTGTITLCAKWIRSIYYVSPDGSDGPESDGSFAKPYQLLEGALNAILNNLYKTDYTVYVVGTISTGSLGVSTTHITRDYVKSLTIRGYAEDGSSTISGNNTQSALRVSTPVPVILENITISDGSATYGGGISMNAEGGSLTLGNGTVITNNISATSSETYNYGGGVYLLKGTIEMMDGARIVSNRVHTTNANGCSEGGGVYIQGGTFEMYGGEISNNRATHQNSNSGYSFGGGVAVSNYGVFKMKGGTISGNIVSGNWTNHLYGGAVYIGSNNFQLSGDVSIPYGGSAGLNDIYIYSGTSSSYSINITGEITSEGPVAYILPSVYSYGSQLLTSSNSQLLADSYSKFVLVATNEPWTINAKGKISGEVYNINYQDKGGLEFTGTNINSLPEHHTYGVDTPLINPVREGWDFNGWYTNKACVGTPVTLIGQKQLLKDITLYAWWSKTAVSVQIAKGDIALTKTVSNGEVILTASSDYTDYVWMIGDEAASDVLSGSSVSTDGKTFTFSTNSLESGKVYTVFVTALSANGIEYSTSVQIKK